MRTTPDHGDRQHYGWLVSKTGTLHYVPGVDHETWQEWYSDGGTTWQPCDLYCAGTSPMTPPGVTDRMHAPRCRKCCALLGIPAGNGTPSNSGFKVHP